MTNSEVVAAMRANRKKEEGGEIENCEEKE